MKTNNARGFATLEILVGATVMAITLLSIAMMYLTAHTTLERSGDTTVAVALARQIIEELRGVPYDSIVEFDGFDTANTGTLPANAPERNIARRWRYAVAGDAGGWAYTSTEKQNWPTFAEPGPSVRGRIQVASPSTSMREVTLTLTVPGRVDDVRMGTLISRTTP